jgi:YebC/PmpR family DNA-binding regulatory protein
MAGHSKWANIKHRKARQDQKRGKVWTKIIREVTVAARLGGAVIEDNPRLRLAVDKALTVNIPKDTIERAISRGAGGLEGGDVEELTYEGYASGGIAVYVEAMTDNRNRTAAEVRHAFSKHGGNLGTDGSVAYLFRRKGVITFAPGASEDAIMEIALDAGADDIDNEEGAITVVTPWDALPEIAVALASGGLEAAAAEVTMLPSTTIAVEGEQAETVLRLIDALEELDDVQNVYSNAELPDELYGDG